MFLNGLAACQTLGAGTSVGTGARGAMADGEPASGLYDDGVLDARPALTQLASAEANGLDPATRTRAQRLLRSLDEYRSELTAWILPLLKLYVPDWSPSARVELVVGQEAPAHFDPHRAVLSIDAGAPEYEGDLRRVLTRVQEFFYRDAIDGLLRRELALTPVEGREIWILSRLVRDGMVRYLREQGESRAWSPTGPWSAESWDLWGAASDDFLRLDQILATLGSSPQKRDWDQLTKTLAKEDPNLLARVGAQMARVIEASQGRRRLMDVVGEGSLAFEVAYRATRPGAMMVFSLPHDRASSVAH